MANPGSLNPPPQVVFQRNITRIKTLREKLERTTEQSRIDSLTLELNRRLKELEPYKQDFKAISDLLDRI